MSICHLPTGHLATNLVNPHFKRSPAPTLAPAPSSGPDGCSSCPPSLLSSAPLAQSQSRSLNLGPWLPPAPCHRPLPERHTPAARNVGLSPALCHPLKAVSPYPASVPTSHCPLSGLFHPCAQHFLGVTLSIPACEAERTNLARWCSVPTPQVKGKGSETPAPGPVWPGQWLPCGRRHLACHPPGARTTLPPYFKKGQSEPFP